MRYARACFILGLVTVLLGGCKSPSASFFALGPDPSLASSGATRPVSVVIGPVTVPDMVDRPQIVTRVGDNEVAVNEFALWAQPLKGDIARVIAADLGALLNSQQVSVFDRAYDPLTVWHVRLDVMGFESVPGRDVTVDVQWAVRPPGKTRSVVGRSVAREIVSGPGFDPIVAAHDRALASVSRDIAAAVQASGFQ
ncbi:membrane integrity-associated transporter subunit PqiC [Paraburkholderia sp. SIMBA_030]|uniref:PqiC family protein n=1 Tax=Paraburkholderia sp. SIMBA_030 TaxID=3085773 RepID=UPI00397916EA